MKISKIISLSFIAISAACCTPKEEGRISEAEAAAIADSYDYIISTQTFNARYGFTGKSRLIETAEIIKGLGCNSIKFSLNPLAADEELNSMINWMPLKLATECTTLKTVLDMDFKHTLIWVTTPGVEWADGMSEEEKTKEYNSMKELTEHLLTTYKGTGRYFYIGHWEGDWLLLGNYDNTTQTIDPVRIQGMTDWYNTRQKAVEDARKAVNSDVKVYNYAEVNRVTPALYKNYDRMVNKVLPDIDVDYISYSSYESIVEEVSGEDYAKLKDYLFKSLDYIEEQLKPRSDIKGKRVFIGEFGYPLTVVNNSSVNQAKRTANVLRAAIEWGCPFALYWEMYDNEGDKLGYWMINSKNVKQPVYYMYEDFCNDMHDFVKEYALANGQAPGDKEFRTYASDWFSTYYPRTK